MAKAYLPYNPFDDPARYIYQSGEPTDSIPQSVKLLASSGGFKYGHYKEVQNLIQFLNASPTAWQAVDETAKRLRAEGYIELIELEDGWDLYPNGKFYVIRGGSSIIAFNLPKNKPE